MVCHTKGLAGISSKILIPNCCCLLCEFDLMTFITLIFIRLINWADDVLECTRHALQDRSNFSRYDSLRLVPWLADNVHLILLECQRVLFFRDWIPWSRMLPMRLSARRDTSHSKSCRTVTSAEHSIVCFVRALTFSASVSPEAATTFWISILKTSAPPATIWGRNFWTADHSRNLS